MMKQISDIQKVLFHTQCIIHTIINIIKLTIEKNAINNNSFI